MPGSEYVISCTACELPAGAFGMPASHGYGDGMDRPAGLAEFFGERGGYHCRYCPEWGYVGEQRHAFKLVCADCGRRGRRHVHMFTPPERCSCGGTRVAERVQGRAPTCPEHPALGLLEMSLIELQDIDGGVTRIPCRSCRRGTLVIGCSIAELD